MKEWGLSVSLRYVSGSSIPIPIVAGDRRAVPAKISLKIYTVLQPIIRCWDMHPFRLHVMVLRVFRVVEERGRFARFDGFVSVCTKENPPPLNDPMYGGWVHRDHLD